MNIRIGLYITSTDYILLVLELWMIDSIFIFILFSFYFLFWDLELGLVWYHMLLSQIVTWHKLALYISHSHIVI